MSDKREDETEYREPVQNDEDEDDDRDSDNYESGDDSDDGDEGDGAQGHADEDVIRRILEMRLHQGQGPPKKRELPKVAI